MSQTNLISGVSSALTANTTLSGVNGNRFFTNEGATGSVTVALPPAKYGDEFLFYLKASYAFVIDPNGTEKLTGTDGTLAAAGKNISADAAAEYIRLTCLKDGEWTVTGYAGTWTVES